MEAWGGAKSAWIVDRLASKQDVAWSLMGFSFCWALEEGLGSGLAAWGPCVLAVNLKHVVGLRSATLCIGTTVHADWEVENHSLQSFTVSPSLTLSLSLSRSLLVHLYCVSLPVSLPSSLVSLFLIYRTLSVPLPPFLFVSLIEYVAHQKV